MAATISTVVHSAPPHTVILASAGSGKTHQLSSRYLRLLYDGFPVDRILATTFTRKAAGEILERVLLRLAESTQQDQARRELAADVGATELPRHRCQQLLLDLTRSLHRIRIGTLDSFFGQVARSFSLELGLPPAWDIIDEHADYGLRRRALETMLATRSFDAATELVHLLNKGEATRRISDMLLETIGEVYELYQESEPDGDAAWRSIPHLPFLQGGEFDAAWLQFQKVELPDRTSVVGAHQKSLAAVVQDDWDSFLTKGLPPKILANEPYRSWEVSPAVRTAYLPLIHHAKAILLNRLIRQTEGAYELARQFDVVYEQLKIEQRAILFSDVPQRLGRMADRPRSRRLAFRMDAHVDHLLLDEFQDTSGMQWMSLKPFAERITQSASPHRSFFCVGDVKQAIYGWRGGQAEILESIDDQLTGISRQQLNLSRRSASAVIDVINRVFTRLPNHDNLGDYEAGFRSWCDVFPRHDTVSSDNGYVCLQAASTDEKDQATATLDFTAQAVQRIVQQAPGCTVGILVRRNQTVSELIHHLRGRDVLASEEGGNPLTDSVAVQQILSLMILADHPGDLIARFHLAHGPLAPEAQMDASCFMDDGQADEAARKIRRKLLVDGYGPCVERWVEQLQTSCSRRERDRLSQLVELAHSYQVRSTLRPGDFVRFVEMERVADPSCSAVRVMTIHQSKGLEFDVVVLTSLEEPWGKTPKFAVQRDPHTFRPSRICRYAGSDLQHVMPREVRAAFEEDRRRRVHEYLCGLYVAMTRSRRALHMIVSPWNETAGGKSKLPRTTAGLLRAALADQPATVPESLLFEHGDPCWHKTDRQAMRRPYAVPVEFAGEVKFAPRRSTVSNRGDSSTSPSLLAGGDTLQGSQLFNARRERALRRGSLVHAWLEQIEWLPGASADLQAFQVAAAQLGMQGEDVAAIWSECQRMLEQPQLQSLLDRDQYAAEMHRWGATKFQFAAGDPFRLQVRNEQRILFAHERRVGSGRIDRLVLCGDGSEWLAAEILDYKTDPIDSEAELDRRATEYGPQLQAYRQAVSRLWGLDIARIRTRLMFLAADRIVELLMKRHDGTFGN